MKGNKYINRVIIIMFLSISFSFDMRAYDFEYEFSKGIEEGRWCFNITSPTTCEFTYYDYKIVDSDTIYNSSNPYKANFSIYGRSNIIYNGVEYKITGIGDHAFENAHIYSLQLSNPELIEYIGKGAFRNSRLLSLTIKNNIREIRESAFEGSKIKTIVFNGYSGDYDIYIPYHTFHKCNDLKSISLIDCVPECLIAQNDAFDITDDKIECYLLIYPDTYDIDKAVYEERWKNVEPWCYFTIEIAPSPAPNPDVRIESVNVNNTGISKVYNLYGQSVGTEKDLPNLPRGIYIVNGKKVVR